MNDLFLYSHSKFFRAIYENYGYSLKALWVVWESIRERYYRLKKKNYLSGVLGIGLFYLHYTPPPPQTARAGLWYCSPCTCTRVASVEELYSCIKRAENRSWPFSLISDGFLRLSSCRRGWWEDSGCETTCYVLQKMATCMWPTTLPSFSTATVCRSKQFSSSTSLQST